MHAFTRPWEGPSPSLLAACLKLVFIGFGRKLGRVILNKNFVAKKKKKKTRLAAFHWLQGPVGLFSNSREGTAFLPAYHANGDKCISHLPF